jgi:hypothetical protein
MAGASVGGGRAVSGQQDVRDEDGEEVAGAAACAHGDEAEHHVGMARRLTKQR